MESQRSDRASTHKNAEAALKGYPHPGSQERWTTFKTIRLCRKRAAISTRPRRYVERFDMSEALCRKRGENSTRHEESAYAAVMASFDPNVPYNQLPPLPSAGEVETARVLKAVIAASRELAAAGGSGGNWL